MDYVFGNDTVTGTTAGNPGSNALVLIDLGILPVSGYVLDTFIAVATNTDSYFGIYELTGATPDGATLVRGNTGKRSSGEFLDFDGVSVRRIPHQCGTYLEEGKRYALAYSLPQSTNRWAYGTGITTWVYNNGSAGNVAMPATLGAPDTIHTTQCIVG